MKQNTIKSLYNRFYNYVDNKIILEDTRFFYNLKRDFYKDMRNKKTPYLIINFLQEKYNDTGNKDILLLIQDIYKELNNNI